MKHLSALPPLAPGLSQKVTSILSSMKITYFLRIATTSLSLTLFLHAQSPNAARISPPLGLLRLNSVTKPNEAAPLAAAKFNVDTLSATDVAGATKAKKNSIDYLALDGGKEWSRPLRGAVENVTFVSFHLYGSIGTVVEIGGVKLGITASDVPNYAQLMAKSGAKDWCSLGLNVPFKTYGGKTLAALPVLTVRLDSDEGTFDVYRDAQLLAVNLSVAAGNAPRRFVVTSGAGGAWICGLVQSDENPLYEDSNSNGVDDQFERRKRGGVAAQKSSLPERKQLAEEWRMEQRTRPGEALFYRGPASD